MALDFPNNPIVGQVFTSGLYRWTWDGTVWRGESITAGPQYSDNFLLMGS